MARNKKKASPPIEIIPEKIGKPRLGHYEKILGRFYEVVFLLKALSQVRNEHTRYPKSPDRNKECLRRFLRGLAYLCDFKKGGEYCTGIGLEETETEYIFWAASNKHRPDLADFIKDVLARLKELKDAPKESKEILRRKLQVMCFEKATKRINTYKVSLIKSINDAIGILSLQKTEHDRDLSTWLTGLNKHYANDLELCDFIFAKSKQKRMLRLLQSRGKFEKSLQGARGQRNAFEDVRHYIGRLAFHTRTHKQLCEDIEDQLIAEIINAPKVQQIGHVNCMPKPEYDAHTNLQGILKRMIKDDDERQTVATKLVALNRECGILAMISSQYDKFTPWVHGEVQILEHFYNEGRKFANNDKYVGCSKPSCECCYLYFKCHRARMVVPESSHKIYPNWSLPAVPNPKKGDPAFNQQRDTLIKMLDLLREDAISQILECKATPGLHPDSVTDLSSTISCLRLSDSNGDCAPNDGDSSDHGLTDWDFSDEESTPRTGSDQMVESDDGDSDNENGGVSI